MSATQAGVARAGARGSSVPAGAPRKATMVGGGAGGSFSSGMPFCIRASLRLLRRWGGVERMRSLWSGRAVVSNVGVVLVWTGVC